MMSKAAATIRSGWILIPSPAEPRGWYRIVAVNHDDAAWPSFRLDGRAMPYVVNGRAELDWSPTRPAPTRRRDRATSQVRT